MAVIFGLAGSISASGIGSFFQESGDFTHDFKVDEVHDGDNEVKSLIASGGMYTGNLLFTPRANANANNIANAAASLEPPAKLAAVTLSGFKLASANHGRWVYTGGWKVAFKKDGVATYALKIQCSEDANVNLAAAVS